MPRYTVLASLLLFGACATSAPEPSVSQLTSDEEGSQPDPGTLGGACAADADCDSTPGAHDGLCYHGQMGPTNFPAQGYCTVDDGTGAVCDTDADCPAGGACIDSEGYKFCALGCSASVGCPPGDACLDSFNGYPMDHTACVPGNAHAVDGDACTGFYDCTSFSVCDIDAEIPNGQCSTFACDPIANTGCNGGTCEVIDDFPIQGAMCVDTCADDSECRTDDGYVCYTPGSGGAPYCRHPHIGDACVEDTDCGDASWSCAEGACTLATACPTPGSNEGCSSGSICATVGEANRCVDRCAQVGDPCGADDAKTCTDVGTTHGGACL